jgi:hypothetical protein
MSLKTSKLSQALVTALLVLALAGCTQWRYDLGDHLTHANLDKLQQGMPLSEVLDIFGPPQRISASPSGYLLAWEHWQVDEDSLGIRLGAMGADILSLDWGKARIRGEFLLVTFDREHHLSGSTVSEWDNLAGGGQGIQPFIGVVSMVDIDDLVRSMPQNSWGATSLQELPRALNTQSSPLSGQSGMEQRGTPPSIGQKSLELR